jgi:hypothetical protein
LAIFFESYLFRTGSQLPNPFKIERLSEDQLERLVDFLLTAYNPYDHGKEPIFKFLDSHALRQDLTYGDATFCAVMQGIMDRWAHSLGKRRWGDKTTHLGVREIVFAYQLFPNGKFIHVVRDPRGVASSFKEAGWIRNIFKSAYIWRDLIAGTKKALSAIPASQVAEVRYEDLCVEPKLQLARLCEFIGEEFSPMIVEHYLTPHELLANIRVAPVKKNLDNAIILGNHTKWSGDLTDREISIIESVCRTSMHDYDYARVMPHIRMEPFDHLRRHYFQFWPYLWRWQRTNHLTQHLLAGLCK